jgi:hypothetical protein
MAKAGEEIYNRVQDEGDGEGSGALAVGGILILAWADGAPGFSVGLGSLPSLCRGLRPFSC